MYGFYVTMISGRRIAYIAGPYATLEAAQAAIPSVRALATKLDAWAHFHSFGVTSLHPAERLGVFNHMVRNDR